MPVTAGGRFLPSAHLVFQPVERLLSGKTDIGLLDYLRLATDPERTVAISLGKR